MECSGNVCKGLNGCPVLNWKNPYCTAGLLVVINFYFLLMLISGMSLVTLCAYFLLFFVSAGVIAGRFMNIPEKDDNEYEYISKETIEKLLKGFYQILVCIDQFMKTVISLSDLKLTVHFYIAVYSIMLLFGWFGECFVFWIFINVMFLWKPIYNAKRDLIIGVWESTKQMIEGILNTIDLIIPKYKDPDMKSD